MSPPLLVSPLTTLLSTLAVFWARRNLKEPPGIAGVPERRADQPHVDPAHPFRNRTFVMWLFGVSCAWFFLDFA